MKHLLVTNDYPPKVGGIQTYLWELWRRLAPDSFEVFTSPHADSAAFDAAQGHRIHRYDRFWLPPTPRVRSRIDELVDASGAAFVVFDPAFPLGAVGPDISVPYAVILHGAEVSVPARLPATNWVLRRAVGGASLVISASRFAEAEARALVDPFPPTVYVPPGVDTARFAPMGEAERIVARRRLGLDPDAPLIVGVSRLVPRKGFDVLIRAGAKLRSTYPNLQIAIAGTGRDEARLRRLIGQTGSPTMLAGYVPDADLPALYGCADGFAMLCRQRWGGLEQEGFGIVFVEAAAAGCPQIAGRSGGSAEAVSDGQTGVVIDTPDEVDAVAAAIDAMLADPGRVERMRIESRRHAVENFDYDLLAARLKNGLEDFAATI